MKILSNKKYNELLENRDFYMTRLDVTVKRLKLIESVNTDLGNTIELLSAEIQELKKNIRKAYKTVTEQQAQAVALGIVETADVENVPIEKVVLKMVEEAKKNKKVETKTKTKKETKKTTKKKKEDK